MFNTYFNGINTGNYTAAWDTFTARMQASTSLADFEAGDSTSFDTGLTVLSAEATGATTAAVALAFNSVQAAASGPNGDT
jgi:hypothetical protein